MTMIRAVAGILRKTSAKLAHYDDCHALRVVSAIVVAQIGVERVKPFCRSPK